MSKDIFVYTFIGGRKKQQNIAATAGNAVATITSTGKRVLILHGRITLVCNITVANRYIILSKRDSAGNVIQMLANSQATIASATRIIGFGELVYSTGATPAAGDDYIGLSNPIVIEGGQVFDIRITNGVAGDSFSGYIETLEIDL